MTVYEPYIRKCNVCGDEMWDGYVVRDEQYFCSTECLHTVYTDEEWMKLYNEDDYVGGPCTCYTYWWDEYNNDEFDDNNYLIPHKVIARELLDELSTTLDDHVKCILDNGRVIYVEPKDGKLEVSLLCSEQEWDKAYSQFHKFHSPALSSYVVNESDDLPGFIEILMKKNIEILLCDYYVNGR